MIRRFALSCFIGGFAVMTFGQRNIPDSLIYLFNRQLEVFPQEKIYVHTDKPYYISGEQLWFRAYLTDAVNHVPAIASRYVYVELIDPLDSVVVREKIHQDEGVYHGRLLIPDDVPEGDYTLRAYTHFMLNQDEHYFFTKTIHIGDPQSRNMHIDTDFSFIDGRREQVSLKFRFSNLSLAGAYEPFVPQSVKVRLNNGKPMNIKMNDDGTTGVVFNLPTGARKKVVLLEAATTKNPYRKFITIPAPDDDFDVAFFPEGGSLMQGTTCKLTFKAMKSDGQATHIAGILYDQDGNEVRHVQSDYLGMGRFPHLAEKGKSYYLVCENEKGASKRFDLPAVVERGFALSVQQSKDKIYIAALKPAKFTTNEALYLLAHTRGNIHFVELWDHNKNTVIIEKEQLPSGVLHLILLDA